MTSGTYSVTVNQVMVYWKEQFAKTSQCRNGNDHTDKDQYKIIMDKD